MTARLELGVEDVAYSDPDASGATTTGQVAEILEKKYHVMRVFVELHGQSIADAIAEGLAKDSRAMDRGDVVSPQVLAGPMGKIEKGFRDYLDADEWQKTTGQAIAAAQNGVSHRFKAVRGAKAKARGPRPAFIDTGLFQASFRAKVKR